MELCVLVAKACDGNINLKENESLWNIRCNILENKHKIKKTPEEALLYKIASLYIASIKTVKIDK